MIYYEISFPLTRIFKNNFVKISLLMTFISISISSKTLNIFENKLQVFEEVIAQLLYIRIFIIINLMKLNRDITQNQKILSRKNTN